MPKKKKSNPSKLNLDDTDPQMGDVLPLVAPGPASDMTKLYANRYTKDDEEP